MGILDLIFPKACVGCGRLGAYLCKACESQIQYLEHQFCPECSKAAIGGKTHPGCLRAFGLNGLTSLTFFSYPVNKLIHALKYRYTADLVTEVVEKINLNTDLGWEKSSLLPVPLYWQKQNSRGFNQSELLGKLYAERLNLNFDDKLLKKEIKTKPQVGLKREERLKNLVGAFSVSGEVRNKNFVVFDDVWTSGATLKNIGQVLKRKGANQVWGFTLARSH